MLESLARYLPEPERSVTVKLRSEPINAGPAPIGHRKTAKIAMRTGSQVRVAYLSGDPSKTIPADNTGLMNEWGECGAHGARVDTGSDLPRAAPHSPAVQIPPNRDFHYLKSTLRRILTG